MRWIGPGLAALLLAACVVDETHPSRRCSTDEDCAGDRICDRGFCIEPDGDPCTVTDTPCDDTGLAGVCMAGRIAECPDGRTECRPLVEPTAESCNGQDDDCDGRADEGIRLDTVTDCGACGASCSAGLGCCNGACVDTNSDDRYCGGCGDEQACDTGAGERCCGGGCRDVRSDSANCGVCGRECPSGQSCCDGACVDLASDPDACGVCGTVCAATERCCRGQCAAPGSTLCGACETRCEDEGLSCCSGSCVDRGTDRNHCGACGNRCEAGEFCCEGSCITSTDENCGACGISCGADELCCSDRCVANNSPNCGACGTTCPPGTQCCGNGCFELQRDPNHCGACGNACAANQVCSDGLCCAAGWTNCGGTCVNTQNDKAHCGGCNKPCVLGCANGRCVIL